MGNDTKTNEPEDPPEEAIGRPKEWSEGRYQPSAVSLAQVPNPKPENKDVPQQPVSTPVTREDYE